jgi:hypothetical protein
MSDGTDSPLELLEKAEQADCQYFSVTDHDDLRANEIIVGAIKAKPYKTTFITGCEISSVFEGRNLHLLCYGFDYKNEAMQKMIAEGARLRRARITAMFDHLRSKHKIIIPDEDKAHILSRAIPGKVHITDAILKLGVNMSRGDIFRHLLDDMESREFKIDAATVMETVMNAHGVTSLAHPIEIQKEYGLDYSELERMIKKLLNKYLFAIEVYHASHGKREVTEYKKIAKRVHEDGLFVSGGSDYHGVYKADVKIGQLNSYGYVPDDEEITILEIITNGWFSHEKLNYKPKDDGTGKRCCPRHIITQNRHNDDW